MTVYIRVYVLAIFKKCSIDLVLEAGCLGCCQETQNFSVLPVPNVQGSNSWLFTCLPITGNGCCPEISSCGLLRGKGDKECLSPHSSLVSHPPHQLPSPCKALSGALVDGYNPPPPILARKSNKSNK